MPSSHVRWRRSTRGPGKENLQPNVVALAARAAAGEALFAFQCTCVLERSRCSLQLHTGHCVCVIVQSLLHHSLEISSRCPCAAGGSAASGSPASWAAAAAAATAPQQSVEPEAPPPELLALSIRAVVHRLLGQESFPLRHAFSFAFPCAVGLPACMNMPLAFPAQGLLLS